MPTSIVIPGPFGSPPFGEPVVTSIPVTMPEPEAELPKQGYFVIGHSKVNGPDILCPSPRPAVLYVSALTAASMEAAGVSLDGYTVLPPESDHPGLFISDHSVSDGPDVSAGEVAQ